jgi:hypothetical protein
LTLLPYLHGCVSADFVVVMRRYKFPILSGKSFSEQAMTKR